VKIRKRPGGIRGVFASSVAGGLALAELGGTAGLVLTVLLAFHNTVIKIHLAIVDSIYLYMYTYLAIHAKKEHQDEYHHSD
jgi:hypothetical protein